MALTDHQIRQLDLLINRMPVSKLETYIRDGFIDEDDLNKLTNIRPELKERLMAFLPPTPPDEEPVPASLGPILTDSTKICYYTHSGSGSATQTSYAICENCLDWEYSEFRSGDFKLSDKCSYDKTEFRNLVKSLSSISFSAEKTPCPPDGGGGWGYYFENINGRYLSFNNYCRFSGDYEAVIDTIQQFIKQHKTKGQELFEYYRQQPHDRAHFGEFQRLPDELIPFIPKKEKPKFRLFKSVSKNGD